MMQRGEDAGDREQPRAEVGQRYARLDRRTARLARNRHDPRDALRDEIETALGSIGSCLPVAGDRCVDEPRIDLRQGVVAQAEAIHHARAIVLD